MEIKSILKFLIILILFLIITRLFQKKIKNYSTLKEEFATIKKLEENKNEIKLTEKDKLSVDKEILKNCDERCKYHNNSMCIGTCTKYINDNNTCVDDITSLNCTSCESSCTTKCNKIIDIFNKINNDIKLCTKETKDYTNCYKNKYNEVLKKYKTIPGLDNIFYCNTINKYMERNYDDYYVENKIAALNDMKRLCMNTCQEKIHPKDGMCKGLDETERLSCRIIPDKQKTVVETFSSDDDKSSDSLSSDSIDPQNIIPLDDSSDDEKNIYDDELDNFSKIDFNKKISNNLNTCIKKYNFTECIPTKYKNQNKFLDDINNKYSKFSHCLVDRILNDNPKICENNKHCEKYIKRAIIGMTTRSKVNKTIRRFIKENKN
jgi:hypothetical protein